MDICFVEQVVELIELLGFLGFLDLGCWTVDLNQGLLHEKEALFSELEGMETGSAMHTNCHEILWADQNSCGLVLYKFFTLPAL